jgi:HlyD family secretion protein
MDKPRPGAARRKLIRRLGFAAVAVTVIPLVTWGLSRLKPAAPTVERSVVWMDTVRRGPMLRQVRGLGTLVPEEILWIPAPADGRVEKILVRPGTAVGPATVLVVLRNQEMEQAVLDAEYQLKAAEAQEKDLRVQLAKEYLTQKATVATVDGDYNLAKFKAQRDEPRFRERLITELDYRITQVAAEQAAARLDVEKKRLTLLEEGTEAQVATQKAKVAQQRGLLELRRSQLEALRVQSGAAGVLQELPVQVGQRVGAGTILAKVAQPERLKAELKVAETQAKDIQLGQVAAIDTRNGVIQGRVVRIDPSVKEGTVTVDVKLEGALPAGARPDLSVDGTIELERLADVVYVARPASGQPESAITLFKLDADGKGAARVQVKLGRSSVNSIEIRDGLRPGDQVILSDMTTWDSYDRIKLQ